MRYAEGILDIAVTKIRFIVNQFTDNVKLVCCCLASLGKNEANSLVSHRGFVGGDPRITDLNKNSRSIVLRKLSREFPQVLFLTLHLETLVIFSLFYLLLRTQLRTQPCARLH